MNDHVDIDYKVIPKISFEWCYYIYIILYMYACVLCKIVNPIIILWFKWLKYYSP